jgi:CrcB protein
VIALLLVSAAGGLGAVARLLLDGLVRSGIRAGYPVGTTAINLSGSLVLGLLTGLVLGGAAPEWWRLVAGTGFLGGYTTFSTASVETVRLLQDRRWWAAVVNGMGMMVGCTLLAALGLLVGLAA